MYRSVIFTLVVMLAALIALTAYVIYKAPKPIVPKNTITWTDTDGTNYHAITDINGFVINLKIVEAN